MNFQNKINPAHTALVVIDVQRDYFVSDGVIDQMGFDLGQMNDVIGPLNDFIGVSRKYLKTIIYTQHIRDDHLRSSVLLEQFNREGISRPYDRRMDDFYEIVPLSDEIVLEKHRYSAFMGTSFDHILRASNIKTLIITGVATNVCVESTARDGFMMDYHIVLPAELTAGVSPEIKKMSLYNIGTFFGEISSAADIEKTWAEGV